MNLKLKNGVTYNVTNVTETKNSNMWFLSFVIVDNISSDEIDKNFIDENISELKLVDGEKEKVIAGYSKSIRATISHDTENPSAAIQMTKTPAEVLIDESESV